MNHNGPSPAIPNGAPMTGPLAGKFVLRVDGNVVRDHECKPVVFDSERQANEAGLSGLSTKGDW